MTKSEAISTAVERVKATHETVTVIRRGDAYDVVYSLTVPRGWKASEMIGPGNVQNF